MDSSSLSMGRFGSKHFDDLENEEQLCSSLESLFVTPEAPANSACLNLEETNPFEAWKLPNVSPSDVYKSISPFQFKALS